LAHEPQKQRFLTPLACSAEHPFWVRGAGWRHAQQINPGDEIVGDDGQWRNVEAVEGPLEPSPVYNVEVEDCTFRD